MARMRVDISPNNPPISVPPGGTFSYHWEVENLTGSSIQFDVWAVFIDSSQNETLADGPDVMSLNPYQQKSGNRNQQVPEDMEPGTYLFEVRAGNYNLDNVESLAHFEFEIQV